MRRLSKQKASLKVYNLLKIMSIGRKKNLAWCDFSELDLRGCQMNGNAFVDDQPDRHQQTEIIAQGQLPAQSLPGNAQDIIQH